MCLAIPARLLELYADLSGRVDLEGTQLAVNCSFVPQARVGDWLLVHAGFAIQRLSDEDANAIWAQWEEVAQCVKESDAKA